MPSPLHTRSRHTAFHTYEFVGRPYILRSVEVVVPEVVDPAACTVAPPQKKAKPDPACDVQPTEQPTEQPREQSEGECPSRERRGGAKRVREQASERRTDAYPVCKVAGHTGFLTFARRAAPLPTAPAAQQ